MINVSIDLRKEIINDTLLNQKLIGRKVQSEGGYYNNVHRPIQLVSSKV